MAIGFHLPTTEMVVVDVLDTRGRLVRRLVTPVELDPGEHRVTWDGRDHQAMQVAAGVYFIRARAGASVSVCRLVLIE